MKQSVMELHPAFHRGPVDERVFGGFLEHLGRAVYQGVYEPGSPRADADGFRTDVLEALGKLRMTAMRYPGGNFASGYHWLDGVGPREQRTAVQDLAWQSIEPNQFGTDEFIRLCRRLGWTPMLTVNLGTGTPEEARNWVEYCNSPTGTRYADLRAANGSRNPHGVRLWCLGNEMDGAWQIGHVPADQYAIRAQQAAKMMKDTDRSIEVVACGSCTIGMPTYMEWDRQVLDTLGDLADYISLHRYVGNSANDTADYLAVGESVDRQIEEMDAACRFVKARRRSGKRVFLCFDEWNVWYRSQGGDGRGRRAPPLLEEVYNLEDALVVAQFLNSFIRHADVVKIANLAQIVNVIAPILTRGDAMLIQSIFYPFAMVSARRTGLSLVARILGPFYESKSYGGVSVLDGSAILGDGMLHAFLVNRLPEPMEVKIVLHGCPFTRLQKAEILAGPDLKAANTLEAPKRVRSVPFRDVTVKRGGVILEIPGHSFAAMSLRLG